MKYAYYRACIVDDIGTGPNCLVSIPFRTTGLIKSSTTKSSAIFDKTEVNESNLRLFF